MEQDQNDIQVSISEDQEITVSVIKPWWKRPKNWLQLFMGVWALSVTGWMWVLVTHSVFDYRQKIYERSYLDRESLVDHVPDLPNDGFSMLDMMQERHLNGFQIKNWLHENGVAFLPEYPVYIYLKYKSFDHQSMKRQTDPPMVMLVSTKRVPAPDHEWTQSHVRRVVISHRIRGLIKIHTQVKPRVDVEIFQGNRVINNAAEKPRFVVEYIPALPKAEEAWIVLNNDFMGKLLNEIAVKKVRLHLSGQTRQLFLSNPDHADVIELELNMREGESIHPELIIYFDHEQDEAPHFKVNRNGLKIFEISKDLKVIPMNLTE